MSWYRAEINVNHPNNEIERNGDILALWPSTVRVQSYILSNTDYSILFSQTLWYWWCTLFPKLNDYTVAS